MSHILVTGGCGFIGCHFVRRVLAVEPRTRITNLDALTYAGNPANLADVVAHAQQSMRYRFIHGDIANPEDVARALVPFDGAPVDAIVNFAAESHVDRSITDSGPFLRTNIFGVHVLLEAARGLPQFARFVQVSTDEVYGSLGSEGLFTEESPLKPSSPYSAAKTSGDLWAQAYHRTFGLPIVITRCSNNYGSYQFPEKLIPSFILKASRNERLPVYGDGQNVRDWIHVTDHVEGVRLALRAGQPGEIYNFGANTERTNMQITRSILAQLGKPESLIQFVADRLGHDRRYAIDSAKASRELNWHPRFSFESGLAETIRWYLENPKWVTESWQRS